MVMPNTGRGNESNEIDLDLPCVAPEGANKNNGLEIWKTFLKME